jgi:hypothetical protein
MADFFASGRALDVVLGVLAIEAVVLLLRGWRASIVVSMLLPAALILTAWRLMIAGVAWPWTAMLLAASFPVHLADLTRRRHQP